MLYIQSGLPGGFDLRVHQQILLATFTWLAAGFVLSAVLGGKIGTLMGLRRDVEASFRA